MTAPRDACTQLVGSQKEVRNIENPMLIISFDIDESNSALIIQANTCRCNAESVTALSVLLVSALDPTGCRDTVLYLSAAT